MSAPSVYAAINAISAELAKVGIAKRHTNQADDYQYRSIDDVLSALAPLLARHRLCILPRVLERKVQELTDADGQPLVSVTLRVAYVLASAEDGSAHEVQIFGEALDASDKATAKALSAAYKSAMVQTFCIPALHMDDPDRTAPKPVRKGHEREPVQGWIQWCLDIEDIITLCESEQALSSVQERNRELLKALSREQPTLYDQLGVAFTSKRGVLTPCSGGHFRKKAGARANRVPRLKRPVKKPRSASKPSDPQDLQTAKDGPATNSTIARLEAQHG